MGKIKKANRAADLRLLGAASGPALDPVRLALFQGADIEARSKYWIGGSGTPLIIASSCGREETVKLLIKLGANLEAKDDSGSTSLISASISGFVGVVELLLEAGAKINETDNQKATALIHAVWSNRYRVVEALIKGGADLYAENEAGRTALDYSCSDYIKEALNEYAQGLKKRKNQLALEKRQIGATNNAESVEEIIRDLEREG